jgi:hypothetical protein
MCNSESYCGYTNKNYSIVAHRLAQTDTPHVFTV